MFCPNCGTSNEDSSRFCKSCGNAVHAASQVPALNNAAPATPVPYIQPPPPPVPVYPARGPVQLPGKRYATERNPAVALLLSMFIVGVGQFYNGDAKKGVVMFISAVVAALITFGFGWFAVAIWSAIDAYQVASGKSPLWS